MAGPKLILCERNPRWLAAWRRALPPERWSWLSCALSLAQAESLLREHPSSVVAVSIAADNLAHVLPAVHRWQREFADARFLALVANEVARLPIASAVLQEAGALLVISRPQELTAAARLVQRHFHRQIAAQQPLPAAVWQRLPWAQYATQSPPSNS